MCGICDDDHQEEYISYKVPAEAIVDESMYNPEDVEID
jgi:hypothetical protein